MFPACSLSCTLFKYLRKGFMLSGLLGLWSCKDFKSWESKYTHEVNIKFEQEKEPYDSGVLKDLGSEKISSLSFIKKPTVKDNDKQFSLTTTLSIPLNPSTNEVSFYLEDANNIHHQKVTIYYAYKCSLISHEAGGLQLQYTIKAIEFSTKIDKKPIFKKYTIETPILIKEKNKASNNFVQSDKAHVTLYY